jgi:energy-converting hydrogenase Eha subunit G
MLAVAALGFAGMAGSPCSPGCPIAVVNAGATPPDAVHNAAAIAAIAGVGFAALELGTSSWFRTPRWYRACSTAAGVGIAVTSMLFLLAVVSANPLSIGTSERAMVLIGLVWVETTAWIRVLGASAWAGDGEKNPKTDVGHFLV